MHFSTSTVFLSLLAWTGANPVPLNERAACTYQMRQQGVAAEIKTIGSHSAADAAKIPLAPTASRTFYVTPKELGGGVTLPPINVGVTADTVRSELVVLATILDAGVPPSSVHYTNNANGTVTVDFIQTDRIVLPYSSVREIHEFDQTTCQITKITGYVHGNVICPTTSTNSVLLQLCSELAKAKAR